MAPLAKQAGGWGQMDAWKSKDEDGYKKMASLVAKSIRKRPGENLNGWEPDLKSGGGEGWVVRARENYRKQIQEQ